MGVLIVHRLHVIKQGDGEHLGLTRDVAANHQHHPELPQGVGKTERRRHHEAGQRHRQDDVKEALQRPEPQGGGGLQLLVAHVDEGGGERLHHEGERVEDGGEQQTGKTEGERRPEGVAPPGAQAIGGGEGQQQIEAEHRRRQH